MSIMVQINMILRRCMSQYEIRLLTEKLEILTAHRMAKVATVIDLTSMVSCKEVEL